MEDLIILLAVLVLLGIPISLAYLLVSHGRLKSRVAALEDRLEDAAMPAPVAKPHPPAPEPVKAQVWTRPEPAAAPPAPTPEDSPPKAVVFTGAKAAALLRWMVQNWFYVVSSVSLALAGIFLVQYGMEQGLLPPILRVWAALGFGAALIVAGEYVRRRFGDREDSATAYLPSTFSAAGIVTLFGAVLSARLLYDFIGPETAFLGMVSIGALALVLGWFNGPLLAATGLVGATVAPFVVGGSTDDPAWLFGYFLLIAVVGLAIDALRRWAWVSVLSLVLGYGAGILLAIDSATAQLPVFAFYCGAMALAAIAIPVRRILPNHHGTQLSLTYFARVKGRPWPEFPTRLAGGAVLASCVLVVLSAQDGKTPLMFWSFIAVTLVLTLALLVWAHKAPALTDLAALPALAMLAIVCASPYIWRSALLAAEEPGAGPPSEPTVLVALGIVVSVAAAWRSLHGASARRFTALGAALFAPVLAVMLEVLWNPAEALGRYPWALHAMTLAALMVVLVERFARKDGPEDRERMSFATLSVLACISFALVILFSSTALTVALTVTIAAAAWLDRRFSLPMMGLFILAGVVTVGYRLVIDPGLYWARNAPLAEMLLSHGGALVGLAVAWVLARSAGRPRTEVLLESAVFSTTGMLLSLLLLRMVTQLTGNDEEFNNWTFGLGATIWLILGFAQLRRLDIGGRMRFVRVFLALAFLSIATLQILLAATLLNPVADFFGSDVLGPPLLNTLIPAYLLPALVLAIGARWLTGLPRVVRLIFAGASVALASLWLGLTIRHFWRGAAGMPLPGIDQPELYSYTLALLIIGAGLFYQSLARRNALLRKAGLVVIGLAVAKVFFVDISGLGGLIRVLSLLLLGLSLAGLAWLNRWAADHSKSGDP